MAATAHEPIGGPLAAVVGVAFVDAHAQRADLAPVSQLERSTQHAPLNVICGLRMRADLIDGDNPSRSPDDRNGGEYLH